MNELTVLPIPLTKFREKAPEEEREEREGDGGTCSDGSMGDNGIY